MVLFPTRGDNTLDLFSTNRPSLVCWCSPLAGLGDHDLVYVESSVTPRRSKPVARKIFLWNKAHVEDMKRECIDFQQAFTVKYTTNSSVQEMWCDIKSSSLHS